MLFSAKISSSKLSITPCSGTNVILLLGSCSVCYMSDCFFIPVHEQHNYPQSRPIHIHHGINMKDISLYLSIGSTLQQMPTRTRSHSVGNSLCSFGLSCHSHHPQPPLCALLWVGCRRMEAPSPPEAPDFIHVAEK